MRKGVFVLFFTAILLTCILSVPAMAWDYGIGFVSVGYGSELADLVEDGIGFSLQANNRFSKNFGLEFLMDFSFHDDALVGSNITTMRLDGGARLYLVSTESLDIYGVAGLSYTSMNFTEYVDKVHGTSIYYGAGLELPVSRYAAIEFSARFHDWDATWDMGPLGETDLDATSTILEAVYVFKGM